MSDHPAILEPVLIGYFAKPVTKNHVWLKASNVEGIYSSDACRFGRLFDWVKHWRHNAEWVFDTPALAWSIVPEDVRPQCQLLGYRLFPVRFRAGVAEAYKLPDYSEAEVLGFAPQPMDCSFERLGYDLIPRYCGNSFECSPLCCATLGAEVPANRYCLLDTAEEAFALAPTLEVPGQPMRGEPGPYHIVEVWRQRVSASTS